MAQTGLIILSKLVGSGCVCVPALLGVCKTRKEGVCGRRQRLFAWLLAGAGYYYSEQVCAVVGWMDGWLVVNVAGC